MEKTKSVSVAPYIIGFVSAVVLTLIAYAVVVGHLLSGVTLIAAIMGLAVVQLICQLVFFLHLGRGKEARWNVAAFFFMLLILVVIVAGSLWIMYSLNYNMMSPEQMNTFMMNASKSGGF